MPDPVTLILRAAQPADEEFFHHVYAGTRIEEMALFGWSAPQQEAFLRMQYGARKLSYAAAYPDAEQSVLLAGDEAVGTCTVARRESDIRLVDIALLPTWRNRGLGRLVMEGLMGQAAAANVPLHLSVARGNPAARLYERLGFAAVSEDSVYIEMEYKP